MRSLSTWCARHTSKLIVHQQKLAAQKRIYYSLKIELQGDVLGRGYQESWLARMETRAWHRGARAIALGGNDRDFRPSRARAFHSGPELRGTDGPRALGPSGSRARLSWERARAFAPRPCRHGPPLPGRSVRPSDMCRQVRCYLRSDERRGSRRRQSSLFSRHFRQPWGLVLFPRHRTVPPVRTRFLVTCRLQTGTRRRTRPPGPGRRPQSP
jgi:hypothetical protein